MSHDGEDHDDGEIVSNLERTIDKIGMGRYQFSLLVLCGFGWMADNMWLEAIAIILPRVQDHYSISNQSIGWLSSSTFFGMMIGAVGWGTCSDVLGRTLAFNATLISTAVFGFAASYMTTGIKSLCVAFFFLGSAIGGSMPTDGTLFMENIPRRKQYLLIALSVFFSFGAVVSAVVALIVIPNHSCPEAPESCDPETQNQGWRMLLTTLSAITMSMFVGRFIFFSLEESPRYLVNTGRKAEAVAALKQITAFNGQPMKITTHDVSDTPAPNNLVVDQSNDERSSFLTDDRQAKDRTPEEAQLNYLATETGAGPRLSREYSFRTPIEESPRASLVSPPVSPQVQAASILGSPIARRPSTLRHSRRRSSMSISIPPSLPKRMYKWVADPLGAWWEKVSSLFTEDSRRKTMLIWAMWWLMSLGYTIFNVYLPKLLESRLGHMESGGKKRALWDIVIFTLGGCPGALLGAWMIETPLGRRKSLALVTFLTAVFCLGFCQVKRQIMVTISTIFISLAATTMWAILYGLTPELFAPNVRGTACGTASAWSRIGGMIAPVLGGHLLSISSSLPMYTAAVFLTIAGICVLLLPPTNEGSWEGNAYYALSH